VRVGLKRNREMENVSRKRIATHLRKPRQNMMKEKITST